MENITTTLATTKNEQIGTGIAPLTHEFLAMGSHMMAALQSGAPFAGVSLSRVPGWFEVWEQQLSRFRSDSELSIVNKKSGESVEVSSEFLEVLQLALAAADDTEGLVTPAVLDALEAMGYDRTFEALSLDQNSRLSDVATLPRKVPDWRAISVDTSSRTIQLPAGMRLDFGGIAKGWAADRAALWLGTAGPALVDAGGDIAVSGPMADGSAWPIGVADPTAPDRQIELLRINAGGVATSGRDYRRWQREGRPAHHIIDPRTGVSAQTDVLSATVVGPGAAAAEVAAKAVLILGSRDGMQWLNSNPMLAGLLVLEDGSVFHSRTFAEVAWN